MMNLKPVYANIREMRIGLTDESGIGQPIKVFLDDGLFKIDFYDSSGTNLKMSLITI
jgi:hypothetical protein